MKKFAIVLLIAAIVGGFIAGELTGKIFLLTGAVIGALSVGLFLFALGGLFSWRAGRNQTKGQTQLIPEMRAVFDRMVDRHSVPSNQGSGNKNSTNKPAPSMRVKEYLDMAPIILQAQLLPKYSNPKQAFGELMTNKSAAGYVFGVYDALLQLFNLRDDESLIKELLEAGYKSIFGEQSGYALLTSALRDIDDPKFAASRKEAGGEVFEYAEKGTMPLGLGRILILGNAQQAHSEKPIATTPDLKELILELQHLLRKSMQVKALEDDIGRTIQQDVIYTAVCPFAYGLIILKNSTQLPSFLDTSSFEKLQAQVKLQMMKYRVDGAIAMAKDMPSLGGGKSFVPDEVGIAKQVTQELNQALIAVCDGSVLRAPLVAKANLLKLFFDSAPYYKAVKNKEDIFSVFAQYADNYISN